MKKTFILLLMTVFCCGAMGVFAQNNQPKNLQKSKNNPAGYRDADGHELVFNIKALFLSGERCKFIYR